MSKLDRDALLDAGAAGLDGDPHDFQVAAEHHLSLGDEATALIALDRAYGLAPDEPTIAAVRATLLDRHAIEEHGLRFCYVPAGSFLMGSNEGDPDERPIHPVSLAAFWIADVPMTWSAYCQLAGWSPPPSSYPDDPGEQGFYVSQANKIRMQYCEGETSQAHDWHAHLDSQQARELFGAPPRQHPERPIAYDRKPMVAVGWPEAEALAGRLSDARVEYALPSEAEWEKAARGGLIGMRYPWGNQAPTASRCDFNHFGDYRIADPRSFPANGYGVYGMAGGVWEWTSTIYDALAYGGAETPPFDPAILDADRRAPLPADQPQRRVLRGGSWADAAAAVTVSFRSAAIGAGWQHGWGDSFNPNIGFRLVRRVRGG